MKQIYLCVIILRKTIEDWIKKRKNSSQRKNLRVLNRIRCFNFNDIQKKKSFYGKFFDFHMKIDCANIPDFVCYNSSMEEYINDINKEFLLYGIEIIKEIRQNTLIY